MLTLIDRLVGDRRLTVVASERSDGDVHPFRVPADVLARRQLAMTGRTWSMVDQQHGTDVHVVPDGPFSEHADRTLGVADIQRADSVGTHVAMWAADCAVVVLAGASGRLVGVHAGWRGLAAGALATAAEELGEQAVAAVLGPSIHSCCYEFGDDDLEAVAVGVDAAACDIDGRTTGGRRALDVPSAVAAGLRAHRIELDVIGPCTACDDRWFSHRARAEPGRHATIAWMSPAAENDEPQAMRDGDE